ncbi:MAG TPA: hypothetical protein VFB74_07675 [Kribbellaceae bacterium]|nr:hypothetical protein [Kribbellaceae bacterium]
MATNLFQPAAVSPDGVNRGTHTAADLATIVASAGEVQHMHTEAYLDEPPRGCSQRRPPGRADTDCPMWRMAATVTGGPQHTVAG